MTDIDASEVEGAADGSLVSEALEIVWGILDDMLDHAGIDRTEYEESLERLLTLARLIG